MSSKITIKQLQGKVDLLSLQACKPDYYPYLLESSASYTDQEATAYDILFAAPDMLLQKKSDGKVYLDDEYLGSNDFLDELDKLWKKEKHDAAHETLPFRGGWFVYLAYELVNEIEPGLKLSNTDDKLPIAFATRIPAALIYDHLADQTWLVCEDNYQQHISEILCDIELSKPASHTPVKLDKLHEEEAQRYTSSIEKILQYIKDGDVFQVNLSRKWQGISQTPINPISVYQNLRKTNPAPFSALLYHGQTSVISSSPERLVRVNDGRVETRPIAGTRPRGQSGIEDTELRAELISNYKERAEHIMLIDLERNDLGRICKPGTITVDELMTIESYAHVHHIVSNISGQLREQVNPGEVLHALFPGGTITGCPKVRCMEIINELEQAPRGAYTGSLGYINHNGDMDLNILIRTLIVNGKILEFRAGAGIVADSSAEHELQETRAKARGMLLAVTDG